MRIAERRRDDEEPKRLRGQGFRGSRVQGAEVLMRGRGFEKGWDRIMSDGRLAEGSEMRRRWRPCGEGAGIASLREKSDQPGMDVQSAEGALGGQRVP
jgi:hypothetical protein